MKKSYSVAAAAGIGWLSVLSGLALIFAPEQTGSVYALPPDHSLRRLLGLRDVMIGLGLLTASQPRIWMRLRAASEAADAVLIGRTAMPKAPCRRKGGMLRAFGAFGMALGEARISSRM